MKIELRKTVPYMGAHGDYYEQEWDWLFRAGNGAPIAQSMDSYRRRADAIHGALLVTGLRLPKRLNGQRWRLLDMMTPRGAARVFVSYGAGGMVMHAQWRLVRGEFIELVEAS